MRRLLIHPWNKNDEAILTEMLEKGEPVRRIAHRLRRSQSSVRARMNRLGLHVSPEAPTMREVRRSLYDTSPSA